VVRDFSFSFFPTTTSARWGVTVDPSNAFVAANSYTWGFWVKPAAKQNTNVLWQVAVGSTNGAQIYFDQTSVIFQERKAFGTLSKALPKGVQVAEWHHIGVVYNGGGQTVTLYYDGVNIGNMTGGLSWANVLNSTNSMKLCGSGGGGETFNGFSADYIMYARALSDAEMTQLYLTGYVPTPAWRYTFGEGTGTTIHDPLYSNTNGTLGGTGIWSSDVPMKARSTAATRLAA
jgi:hypothetical protein